LNADDLDIIAINVSPHLLKASIIAELVAKEGAQKWVEMLDPMIEWMANNPEAFMTAGLDTFCSILEKSDENLHVLVPKILRILYKVFTEREDISEQTREKILMLVFLCIGKVAWAEYEEPTVVQRCLGETYSAWMSIFTSVLHTSPEKLLGPKLQIFKILCILFRDIKSLSAQSTQGFVFTLFKCLKKYLENFIW